MVSEAVMTVLRCENLSDVRLQETDDEPDQDIEQVIPVTIAIFAIFGFSAFDMKLAFAVRF
jgi:hypothetical protein